VSEIDSAQADALVVRHARPGASLMAVLHGIQHEVGYVPDPVIAPLGRALNLSRAEVYGVLTYYPHFRRAPAATVTIQLCRAEACQSVGGNRLAEHIEERTGCRFVDHRHPALRDTAAAAAEVALEPVYCLGQCALSPALTLNDRLHVKVTPERFDALYAAALADAAKEAS
jgi:formate dehydrogenase subunit gamma